MKARGFGADPHRARPTAAGLAGGEVPGMLAAIVPYTSLVSYGLHHLGVDLQSYAGAPGRGR